MTKRQQMLSGLTTKAKKTRKAFSGIKKKGMKKIKDKRIPSMIDIRKQIKKSRQSALSARSKILRTESVYQVDTIPTGIAMPDYVKLVKKVKKQKKETGKPPKSFSADISMEKPAGESNIIRTIHVKEDIDTRKELREWVWNRIELQEIKTKYGVRATKQALKYFKGKGKMSLSKKVWKALRHIQRKKGKTFAKGVKHAKIQTGVIWKAPVKGMA